MSFAESVALKLKTDLRLETKVIEGFQDKDNLLLIINPHELIQIMSYKRGLTGRKYYLSWAMELPQAVNYLTLVKRIEFDKVDFKKSPIENSVGADGHISLPLKKNMLWHLVLRETTKLETITVSWVTQAIKSFIAKKQKVK